jgi:shikimate dehydrogenase
VLERGRAIAGTTGVLAVLGHPIDHSRSPQIHNAAFAAQGLDLVYVACDVAPADLVSAVAGLRALSFRGANVTVPHKQAVLPLLDRVDDTARQVGAVNTIVNREGSLFGANTDVAGFLAALDHAGAGSPSSDSCLVLGAGGAARAVVAGLVAAGAGQIIIYNRTTSRAEELCAAAATWGRVPCRVVERAELAVVGPQVRLIVNATSVGLDPSVKVTPLPVDIVSEHHIVMDLVYGNEATALVRHARARGALTVDGREMLVQQAARAYELWTGRAAPLDVMRNEVMRN